MKKKDFERSMGVILANFKNASHVGNILVEKFNEDMDSLEAGNQVDPIVFDQLEEVATRFQTFSEMSATTAQALEKAKKELENATRER